MPTSDRTPSDRTGSDSTGSDGLLKADPSAAKGKRSRQHEGPQPLTVFTGSHGLQGDKPRAGEDADPDDTSTPAGDPDFRPDLRR
jgi:hypothetical protein